MSMKRVSRSASERCASHTPRAFLPLGSTTRMPRRSEPARSQSCQSTAGMLPASRSVSAAANFAVTDGPMSAQACWPTCTSGVRAGSPSSSLSVSSGGGESCSVKATGSVYMPRSSNSARPASSASRSLRSRTTPLGDPRIQSVRFVQCRPPQQPAVQRLVAGHDGARREPRRHRARRPAHPRAQQIVAQQPHERVDARGLVALVEQQAADAIAHELGQTADARCDGRHPTRGGLERREAEALAAAGHEQHVGVRQDRIEVGPQPEAHDAVADARLAHDRIDRRAALARADEPQLGVDVAPRGDVDPGHRLGLLDRAQVGHVRDPRRRARIAGARAEARQVDEVRQDGGRALQAEELGGQPGEALRHGRQRVGAGEQRGDLRGA